MSMTGVNLEKAQQDLNNFRDAADAIESALADASNTFADVVIHNWASPKAVEFAGKYTYKLIDIFVKPKEEFSYILNDAALAVSQIAESNGASFDSSRYFPLPTTMFYGHGSLDEVVEVSPNGETGMNIEVVKAGLDTFVASLESANASMDDLPTDIALYDETGELKASFADKIAKAKAKVTEIITEIKNDVQASLSTETDAVITGVKTALDEMRED